MDLKNGTPLHSLPTKLLSYWKLQQSGHHEKVINLSPHLEEQNNLLYTWPWQLFGVLLDMYIEVPHTLKHSPCGSLTVREWSKISTISRCSLSEKATAASLIQPISGINCHTTYKEQSVCICNANPAACCHMFNVCFLAFCCECRKRVKL